MFSRNGVAWLFLLCTVPAAAHEPIILDARRATEGLRLELTDAPPTKGEAVVGYRLHAVGLPRGVVFGVWVKDFGHSFHELASGFQVDESGDLVSRAPATSGRRLDEMTFEPGPFPRGAIWEVAIVSTDQTLKAFAKAIPQPIAARDGPCTVSLELVSHRGERFIASGTGFGPGEEVITESSSSGRVVQKRRRITPEGLLPPEVISHGATSADRSASYAVKSRSCSVAVEYEWGEPALSRH